MGYPFSLWLVSVTHLLGALGCRGDCEPPPLDDLLRLNHLQMKGTHNSYHVAPQPFVVEDLDYTLPPLRVQLAKLGVRQVELDVHKISSEGGGFRVFHIPLADEGTTCPFLQDCLSEMRAWSDENPRHHPLVIYLEPKNTPQEGGLVGYDGTATQYYEELDAEIRAAWPAARLLTPDQVQGSYPTLAAAIAARGWPTLRETRGRALFVLLDTGDHRRVYTHDETSLAGRVMFADSTPEKPYAAFLRLDDPVASEEQIRSAVASGFLVRTRADDVIEPPPGARQAPEAALRSGAHFLSTDYPAPGPKTGYVLDIPGGSPTRCNPVSAPPACTSAAIERPDQLRCR